MSKYIDKEALEQRINTGMNIIEPMQAIMDAPAAVVRPVVWGEWIDRGSLSCRCSMCGCKSTKESNYCPNCGADMRGSIPEERTAAMWASRPTSESEAAQFARRVGREEAT